MILIAAESAALRREIGALCRRLADGLCRSVRPAAEVCSRTAETGVAVNQIM